MSMPNLMNTDVKNTEEKLNEINISIFNDDGTYKTISELLEELSEHFADSDFRSKETFDET